MMRRTRANRDARTVVEDAGADPIIVYPEADGESLDTQLNGVEMVRITETLEDYFAAQPDIYVWMNMFVYYEDGNPSAVVGPDVFVVRGVPKEPMRRVYKVWEEGKPPSVVFEITSESTKNVDLGLKRERYALMGVAEYFMYDPLGDYLRPQLQGYRLTQDRYEIIAVDANGSLVSQELGLCLRLVGGRLHFFNQYTGERLLSRQERLDAATLRIAELEALLGQRESP